MHTNLFLTGVHPNALDEEIEGPSVKFQKFKAMVLKLMNTIFITIQVKIFFVLLFFPLNLEIYACSGWDLFVHL